MPTESINTTEIQPHQSIYRYEFGVMRSFGFWNRLPEEPEADNGQ